MKNIDTSYKNFEKEMAMIKFPIKMDENNLKIEDGIKIKSQKMFKYYLENEKINDSQRKLTLDENQVNDKIIKIKENLNKKHIKIINIDKNIIEKHHYEKIVFKEDYSKGKLEYITGIEEIHFIEVTYFDKRYNENKKVKIKNRSLKLVENLEKIKLLYDGNLTKTRIMFFYSKIPKENLLNLINSVDCKNENTNLKQEILD